MCLLYYTKSFWRIITMLIQSSSYPQQLIWCLLHKRYPFTQLSIHLPSIYWVPKRCYIVGRQSSGPAEKISAVMELTFYWCFQRAGFWFHLFSSLFVISYPIDFISLFPFFLLDFVLICSSFSSYLMWKLRIIDLRMLFFPKKAIFKAMNFPQRPALLQPTHFGVLHFHYHSIKNIF